MISYPSRFHAWRQQWDRLWVIEDSVGAYGFIVGAWHPDGTTNKSVAHVRTEGSRFLTNFRVASHAAGFYFAFSGRDEGPVEVGGVISLDLEMRSVQSTPLPRGHWVFDIATGEDLIAVAWRESQGRLQVDLLDQDLVLVRREVAAFSGNPGDYSSVALAWRDGGFDMFLGSGAKSSLGYGRVPRSGQPIWKADFYGNAEQRNLVSNAHTLPDGRQLLLYSRYFLGESSIEPEAVLGLVTHAAGRPFFSEIFVTKSGSASARVLPLSDRFLFVNSLSGHLYSTLITYPP